MIPPYFNYSVIAVENKNSLIIYLIQANYFKYYFIYMLKYSAAEYVQTEKETLSLHFNLIKVWIIISDIYIVYCHWANGNLILSYLILRASKADIIWLI